MNHNIEIQLGSAQQVGNEGNVNVTKLTLPELFSKVEGSGRQVFPPPIKRMENFFLQTNLL